LEWRRPDGSTLSLRHWWLPLDDGLNLAWLEVTEKENRLFTPPVMQYILEANLENKARLLGYNTSLPVSPASPGSFQLDLSSCTQNETGNCAITMEFYWQGLSEMELPYQIFFHLVDAQGQLTAQRDAVPGRRAKEPTTGWLPGEIIPHPVELPLPPDLPPGPYTLHLGMYLPPNGPRLHLLDQSGQPISDFIKVGAVEIKR
jgi:hypothetical protein